MITLPPALEFPCAFALSFRSGSTGGLDRIGGRTQFVRGDVRDDCCLASSICGMPGCPAQVSGRGHAMAAARELRGAPRNAAYAAGQAAVVAHVAAHELGAAAYAIKAVRAAAPGRDGESAGRLECRWQREQLPDVIRELVLDDQRLRNDICWSVFGC